MEALALAALEMVFKITGAVVAAQAGMITPAQARQKMHEAHEDFAAHHAIDDKIADERRQKFKDQP